MEAQPLQPSNTKPLDVGNGQEAEEEELKLSAATEMAIKEMCHTEFCRPDQELTAQINELFPTEQSLAQLDTVIAAVEAEIHDLDVELAALVESHDEVGAQGEAALQEAQKAMSELERRIDSIRGKTRSSDEIVREMTRDIKQLDIAKRNLTSSITTLHHLHILLTGVDSLGTGSLFLPLKLNIDHYYMVLLHLYFLLSYDHSFSAVWVDQRDYASIARQLPAILNVLQLFDDFQEVEQMAKITNRLNKLKQALTVQLAGDMKAVFQAGQLSERVTDMCRVAAALEGSVKSNFCRWFIDQQLSEYTVLYAENEEGAWLDKIEERYKWYVRKLTDFERTGLAKVFPPDWDMGRLMTKEFCNVTRSGSSAEVPSRECSTHAVPFSSSADMFLLLKKVITECSKLSSEPDALLKDVVGVVRVCLRNYAHGCLTAFLPTAHGQQSGSSTANLFNLIREDTTVLRLSADQQFLTCCILATADWCAETTLQLQEKLAQRLAGVDLSQEMETFYGITNQALAVLVQDLEGTCDTALQAISKITWSTVDGVGDESPFVGAIRSHLRAAIPRLRDLLSDRRKYFAHLNATIFNAKLIPSLFGFYLLASIVVMSNMDTPEDFVEHYSTLLPDSNTSELQKVLDMRGVKKVEQTAILQAYRQRCFVLRQKFGAAADAAPTVPVGMGNALSATQALNAVVSMAADGLAETTSMRRLEKLVKRNF
uniref:Vacuolar protein sorting-associated protein 53 homolog n=1 Tax=Haemonchus placei TaxID=6290 RepID=A0A0N4X9B2_HAEPC